MPAPGATATAGTPAGDESPLDVGWTGPVAAAATPAAAGHDAGSAATLATQPMPTGPGCTRCGQGHIVDGYCDHCGSPPVNPRDHFAELPTTWVGAACDIGIRHATNEDAFALHAPLPWPERAVLVVCDGVSNTVQSDVGSLAASTAARDVLAAAPGAGLGTPESIAALLTRHLGLAVQAAQAAIAGTAPDEEANPPSCTFVAAVVVPTGPPPQALVVAGNLGDSRAYWLPDDPGAAARQLTQDDSWAAESMRLGMERMAAESGPNAHAIVRWLGRDAPTDRVPHVMSMSTTEPGWVLVCSDGLWNYRSEAADLAALVREHAATAPDPRALAESLVAFANTCGGQDNITVALARIGAATTPPVTERGPDA